MATDQIGSIWSVATDKTIEELLMAISIEVILRCQNQKKPHFSPL
jgi:hypothetical protein